MDTENQDPDVGSRVGIPIKWNTANVVTRHANNLIVQADEHSVYISFFEVIPPMLLGDTPEEKQTQAESIEHVEANCVARIVVNAGRVGKFIEAIQTAAASHEKVTTEMRSKSNKEGE